MENRENVGKEAKKEVLIIIPAYNEEKTIVPLLEKLEQPEIAQDGGLLVLVHSAGRHLSRLLYGQSGGRGPLPLEQLHQGDIQGLGQGLQQLQVGKPLSRFP